MAYKIPLFDLNYGKEEEEAVLKVIRSKWISIGPKVQEIEKKFSTLLKVKHAVALSSCTSALHLALKILGVSKNDEVIVPSLTFVATVNAVRHVDAIPVFADITSSTDFSIDPEDIKRKITKKTKAIIVMHYGGFSCEMDEILKIRDDYNIFLVEDAAHALLSKYKERIVGTIGDIGCFSFFTNKNITCAEGGLLVTNEKKYSDDARLLSAHGMTTLSYERAKGHATKYDVLNIGYNYRLDDIRAALLIAQLEKLKGDNKKREVLREAYIQELEDINDIIIPYKNYKYKSSNYIFPIVIKQRKKKDRDIVRELMSCKGIQTSIHYPAVHKFFV